MNFPEPVNEKLNSFFNTRFISDAKRFIKLSHVSISFNKGDLESYCITSGIVRDDRAHECKFVFKKRFEGTETPALTSNCDCHFWTKEEHCQHIAALFSAYLLQSIAEGNFEVDESLYPAISINTTMGVNPLEYGTILHSAHQLQGAAPNATYSSLQYLLADKKVVNFPIPEKLVGKLIVHLNSEERAGATEGLFEVIPQIKFSYINENDEIINEMSIFENIYLFNWKEGRAYHFTRDQKSLIQRIRFNKNTLQINDFIRFFQSLTLDETIKLYLDDIPFEDIPRKQVFTRVSIEPGEKKNYLRTILHFYDDQQGLLPPPEFLGLLTFSGGELGNFRKKRDAYDFITSLNDYFDHQDEGYKTTLHSTSKREIWLNNIKFLITSDETTIYDYSHKELCVYDNKYLREFVKVFTSCFGESSYRFSSYNKEARSIHFDIGANTLLQGIGKFYSTLSPYGLTVYYNKKEISKWKSRIKFERRKSTTQWFDLDLAISKEDLEIIEKADLDTGMVLTSSGLIMLTQEQKDLLRFMKKYTKYESEKVDPKTTVLDENGDLIAVTEEISGDDLTRFRLPFNRARIFELFELKKIGIEGALTEEEEALCERLATLDSIPEYPLSKKLDAIMRPYQKTGYNWLRFLYENKLGACLADDMGLGKTLQVISFLESIYDTINAVLIVCPVSILLNWEQEVKKFSDLEIHIYHGGDRKFPTDKKIIITSYGVMKKEVDAALAEKEFDVLILDEVQHLKNIRSMGAFAARKIKADFRICLTGTPVENDLAEFYNILDLSVPGVWGDLQFIRTSSNKKSRLLARKTAAPFILRRTKKQVLSDLPPKIENNVYLSLTDEEKDHYENSLSSIRNKILHSPSKKKYGEILKGLLELRQNCLWQKRPDGNGTLSPYISSTKINFLMETLEQVLEEGHQAIVFSQFTSYLDIIQNTIQEKHWKHTRIDGSQSIKKRQEQVEIFQKGGAPIFLISLKAGGVGLNLTAASYVFVMDPWWNPAVEAQAIDRAHRIGQKNTLTVYRPIIKNSVEEKVLELQEIKKQLFFDLLPENEGELFSGKLSMLDFEHLLA